MQPYYQNDPVQVKEDRELRPGAFGKFCTIYSIAFCSLYTVAAMFLHVLTGVEMSTLTTCVFTFFGGELMVLGTVRVVKKVVDSKQSKKQTSTATDPAA